MIGEVVETSGSFEARFRATTLPDRSARRATDPEMAQRRRAGGGEADTGGGRDAPGRQCLAALGQRLPPLRVRPVGPSVASEAGARRCRRGAFRGRYRGWI